jgi:hypothetical protein
MSEDRNNFSRISVGGTFKIIKGLTVDADYTYGGVNGRGKQTGGSASGIDFWSTGAALTYRPFTSAIHDRVIYDSDWTSSNNGRVVATYQKTIKDHAFKVMGGGEAETFEYASQRSERRGLMDQNKGELNLTSGDQFTNGSHGNWATSGIFGRSISLSLPADTMVHHVSLQMIGLHSSRQSPLVI